jgi:hypothetical protein
VVFWCAGYCALFSPECPLSVFQFSKLVVVLETSWCIRCPSDSLAKTSNFNNLHVDYDVLNVRKKLRCEVRRNRVENFGFLILAHLISFLQTRVLNSTDLRDSDL